MWETSLTDEPKPEGKKTPPVAMIGAGVAIGASLLTVFIATGNRDKDEPAAPAQAAAADPADDQTATAGHETEHFRRSRQSRRSKLFPVRPQITLQPDEDGRSWRLSIVATTRTGGT